MHFSGILIRTRPESTDACASELAQCTGIDVYATDADNGRIVVVLETGTVQEQEEGLRRAQSLPHVISAELVYHYFGDEDNNDPQRERES